MRSLLVVGFLVPLTVVAMPTVTDVSIVQSGTQGSVDLSFTLTGDEPAVVTLDIQTNGVSIGASQFADVSTHLNQLIEPGSYTLKWKPYRFFAQTMLENVRAVFTAWPRHCPPPYLVADLSKVGNVGNRYYESADAIPGGITNELYKTSRLLMRKIPAAGVRWYEGGMTNESPFAAGEEGHPVALSADYYIGIYEITQCQYTNVTVFPGDYQAFTNKPDSYLRPVNYMSYQIIRGSINDGIDWPSTGTNVTAASSVGKFRERTGLLLDLPTEAQWEFACRAGTTSPVYVGGVKPSEKEIKAIAWTRSDFTQKEPTCAYPGDTGSAYPIQPVGLKEHNDFGLYDMLGNMREFCLDYYDSYMNDADVRIGVEQIDPEGPIAMPEKHRINRGGSVADYATEISSAYRWHATAGSARGSNFGFRLAAPAVIP